MANNQKPQVSEEVQKQARNIVLDAFRQMANHSRKMAEDIEDFNRQRKEVREQIENGARQNSGHIV